MYIILKLKQDEIPSQAVINKALADKGLFVRREDRVKKLNELNDKLSIIVLI